MSKKVSSTAIGAFVVGGVALLAAAVAIFGGKDLFADKTEIVSYFDGTTKGLRVGSNVSFRGVRVGYVESLQLVMDVDTLESVTEVRMILMHEELQLRSDGEPLEGALGDEVRYEALLKAGLSAQLDYESFVTGQLLVNIDFRPELNPKLARLGPEDDTEVPTVHTSTQIFIERVAKVFDKLQQLDIEKLVSDVEQTVSGANELVHSRDLRESLAAMNGLFNAPETQALTKNLTTAIDDLQTTLATARTLLTRVDTELEPALKGVGPAMDQFHRTLAAARATLESANDQIRSDSELSYHLERTLADVSDAARSLNSFLDMLDRNPEALIRGKK